MKTVLFGMLQGLGGWLVTAGLFSWYLQSQHGADLPSTIGFSLAAGLMTWAAFGLFVSAIGRMRERAIILHSAQGEKPRDGKQAVLVGRIEPVGARLTAPLDGSDCVMYTYEIIYDAGQGRRRSRGQMARGTALAPSRIVTKAGTHKLLAVPSLEGESATNPDSERMERFFQHARRTTFTPGDKSHLTLTAEWSDDDGAFRSDVAFGKLEGADSRFWTSHQQHVPVGAKVCVFGLYDERKGGIVPSAATPTRLICGSPEDVAATLKSQVMTRSLIGFLLTAPLLIAYLVNR